MEKLPAKEIARIHPLLLEDEERRRRDLYNYAYDILKENSIVPFSIWPIPNVDARRIIIGEITFDDLLLEDQNEVEKGIFFEDLRRFMAQYMPGGQILCEALAYKPCLRENCVLFRAPGTIAGGEYGLCEEYKIAFVKPQVTEETANDLEKAVRQRPIPALLFSAPLFLEKDKPAKILYKKT